MRSCCRAISARAGVGIESSHKLRPRSGRWRSATTPNLTPRAFNSDTRQLSLFAGDRYARPAPRNCGTRHYRHYSSQLSTPLFPPGKAPSFAFAFDIDGVLLHVAKPIPGAPEALRFLQDNNIPFILLTNGGGKHETERVLDLESRLGVDLTTSNFVQSHTPFQELVSGPGGLEDKTVLITGADAAKCRDIAERYGFKNVVIPADILVAYPTIWPFDPLMEELYKSTARPLPKPLHYGTMTESECLKIDAMFVFNDPRDWALDIQIILDLLLSRGGVLGTYSSRNGDASLPGRGWQSDGQPPLYFSNADLFWSTTYHQPRIAQGAFQAALAGVWARITGGDGSAGGVVGGVGRGGITPAAAAAELQRTVFGKPFAETYRYAERVLLRHRAEVLRKGGHGDDHMPLRTVYMVGDNPESDIRGANQYRSKDGTDWHSILVRTGVYREDRGEPAHKPRTIVDDARSAVRWALKNEGFEMKMR